MTEDEKTELWNKLEEKRRRASERYRLMVAEAELNMAFLCGQQWTYYNLAEGIERIRNTSNETLDVDNRILPAYLRMMNDLYGDEPAIVAYEGGLEVKDSMAGKCAVQLCDYLNKNNGWEQARIKVGAWMMFTGTAYIMPYWKKNARMVKRSRKTYVEEGVPTDKGISHVLTRPVDEYAGDIAFEVLNPLNVYCFPLDASSWSDVQSIMVVNCSTYESICRRIGEKVDAEKLEAMSDDSVNFEALKRINRFVSPQMGYAADMSVGDRRYLEMQYFERPTVECPRGRYIHAFGGMIWRDEELPYVDIARAIDPGDNHNLTMGIIPQFSYVMPGMLHPLAPVTVWRPAQMRINDQMTDVKANRKSFGRNKLLIEENAIDDEEWTDEHGQIVRIKPGSMSFAPQFIQASPLQGINQELERSEYSLQQVTGQTNVTQGMNDTQVRSAMHFEMLKNSAATVNWMIINNASECETMTAKFVVQMVKEYWDEERIYDAVGRDRANYYLAFRDSVLAMDVRFKRGTGLARNYILREETLDKWLQYGLFSDSITPDMRRKFMRASELGFLFDCTDLEAPHRNRAEYENLKMAMGEAIEPVEDENHLCHIEVHEAYLQTPEGRNSAPNIESLIRAHIGYHKYMYSSQVAPQLEMEETPIAGLGNINLAGNGRIMNAAQDIAAQRQAQQNNNMTGGQL